MHLRHGHLLLMLLELEAATLVQATSSEGKLDSAEDELHDRKRWGGDKRDYERTSGNTPN
jgi:hypothetical protein